MYRSGETIKTTIKRKKKSINSTKYEYLGKLKKGALAGYPEPDDYHKEREGRKGRFVDSFS